MVHSESEEEDLEFEAQSSEADADEAADDDDLVDAADAGSSEAGTDAAQVGLLRQVLIQATHVDRLYRMTSPTKTRTSRTTRTMMMKDFHCPSRLPPSARHLHHK
jgi:hypothetical protein